MTRGRFGLALGVLLVQALSACAGGAAAPDSGVEGHVWVGPMCPVVRQDVPCPDAPLEADLEVVDGRGRVVARTRSAADGAYRLALDPGEYTLVPLSPNDAGMPFASPIALIIEDGKWTSLDVTYDSGIR